jgi:hypothetical protein
MQDLTVSLKRTKYVASYVRRFPAIALTAGRLVNTVRITLDSFMLDLLVICT